MKRRRVFTHDDLVGTRGLQVRGGARMAICIPVCHCLHIRMRGVAAQALAAARPGVRGPGHEAGDAHRIMGMYRKWGLGLFPGLCVDDLLAAAAGMSGKDVVRASMVGLRAAEAARAAGRAAPGPAGDGGGGSGGGEGGGYAFDGFEDSDEGGGAPAVRAVTPSQRICSCPRDRCVCAQAPGAAAAASAAADAGVPAAPALSAEELRERLAGAALRREVYACASSYTHVHAFPLCAYARVCHSSCVRLRRPLCACASPVARACARAGGTAAAARSGGGARGGGARARGGRAGG